MSSYGRMSRLRQAAIHLLGLVAFAAAACASGNADAQSPPRTPGRELVDTIGIENIVTSSLRQQTLMVLRRLQEANKGREQEVLEIFDKVVMPQAMYVFTADPMKDELGKYFDQSFSVSELQDLIKFFSTPAGRKFAERSSFLGDRLSQLAERLMVTATVQGASRLGFEEMEKRGLVIPRLPAP